MILIFALVAAASYQPVLSPAVKDAMAKGANSIDSQTLDKFDRLSRNGDHSASELLGEIYIGIGGAVAIDPAKACSYFERAAMHRADAAHNFANCHYRKQIANWDAAQARIFYQRAIDGGWPSSRCALGNMLVDGMGGPKDVDKGIALCRAAAEGGDADAQTDLGDYLLTGQVVPRDVVQARKWYTLAAEQKQRNAAFTLGQIHWNGDGTPVDITAAQRWWKIAYETGRKDAAGLLVRASFRRMISEQDGKQVVDRSLLPETIYWLERAATEEPDPVKRKSFAETLKTLTSAN